MNSSTETDRRIGKWSAIGIVVLSALYITTGGIWFVSNIDDAMTGGLQPSEPYLTVLESLMFLVNPAMVTLFAAMYAYAPTDKKTYSLSAFGFLLITVTLTGFVHFAQLFVARRTASETVAEALRFYSSDGRLTAMFAADMLAWDLFFGLALLFAAPAFQTGRLQNAIRIGFTICGLLCLIGVAFPVTGDARFQLPAILGYAFGFPILCLLLVVLFSRKAQDIPLSGSQLS